MEDRYQKIVDLYDELEAFRQRRYRLAVLWVVYILGLLIFPFSSMRLTGIVGLVVTLIVAGFIGMILLARTTQNEVAARDLEREVRNLRLRYQLGDDDEFEKPKREYYTVGDDGELVQVDDTAHTESNRR